MAKLRTHGTEKLSSYLPLGMCKILLKAQSCLLMGCTAFQSPMREVENNATPTPRLYVWVGQRPFRMRLLQYHSKVTKLYLIHIWRLNIRISRERDREREHTIPCELDIGARVSILTVSHSSSWLTRYCRTRNKRANWSTNWALCILFIQIIILNTYY
jgi:hypothetical protein